MLFTKNHKIDLGNINVRLQNNDSKSSMIFEMLQLTECDLKYLKHIKPIISDNIDIIVDNFYNVISIESDLTDIINQHSNVDRLKRSITPHILEMFDGTIDERYVEKRKKVASVHVRIGLSSKNYILSFTSILKDSIKLINEKIKDEEDKLLITQALVKIISLEKFLVLDKFDRVTLEQQQEIKDSKDKLSSSIIDSSSSLAAISEETNASHIQLKEQVHNILNFVMKAKEIAIEMTNKANEGKSSIQKQSESMHNIIISVAKIEEEMMGLSLMNRQIEEIVSVINGISNQTKLISLNAQIEASHAGEYGKGFNVVAQEVRKLSEEASQSIKLASSLLSTIHGETDKLRNAVGKVNSAVQDGVVNLNSTESSFEEIMSFTSDNEEQSIMIKNEILDLEVVIKEISVAFDEVTSQADKLSLISHELL